jgi:heme exporter protein B
MKPFLSLVGRDLRLAVRQGGALGTALGFYLMVVTLLPLGIGADLDRLSHIAAGVLWIALLLSALLSLGRMFEDDDQDGSLDILAMGPLPLELVCAAKALAHWLSTGLPLVLVAPVLGLMLNLPAGAFGPVAATMLLGTPAVSFLGSIGAALTLRSRRGGLLLAFLVLPFYVPTLIYGIGAIDASQRVMEGFWPSLMIITALSLGSMVLGPVASAAALRHQLQ